MRWVGPNGMECAQVLFHFRNGERKIAILIHGFEPAMYAVVAHLDAGFVQGGYDVIDGDVSDLTDQPPQPIHSHGINAAIERGLFVHHVQIPPTRKVTILAPKYRDNDLNHDQHNNGYFQQFGALAGGFFIKCRIGVADDRELAIYRVADVADAKQVQG
jgi:hypothetical protein